MDSPRQGVSASISDATTHIIRTRLVEDCIVLSHGAGQVEVVAKKGDTILDFVLTPNQAEALALDLLARCERKAVAT